MRLLYAILKLSLPYAFQLYFRRIVIVNSPKKLFGRTIYVSNHPASFMDPLVVAAMRLPIVFFMTRSDVFKTFAKPFFWMAHMIPIYRQHDGGDTKDLNQETFRTATKVLSSGRNLLIFGEGFTDDVFIRRLKPVKKGALRIGFGSLEAMNWKQKIYIAAVGNNYTEPSLMRSELLISTSNRICLNDYKEDYKANPNKVINELTKLIEKLMQEQITHVANKDLSDFHEQIMMITRKGMNADSSDKSIQLKQRWKYSRQLALWLNEQNELSSELSDLKSKLERYFNLLKRLKIRDELIFELSQKGKISRTNEVLKLIAFFPLLPIGLLHCAPVYFPVKRFVEKSFKRRVFWGSTKLMMGTIGMGLLNIPFIFLFHAFIYESWLLAFIYYCMIGIAGLGTYEWFMSLKRFKEKGFVSKAKTDSLVANRNELKKEINQLISKR